MMAQPTGTLTENRILEKLVESLDIPESLYAKAVNRHRSVGEWLCRPESRFAKLNPHVSPQGSFRYGTVNRPLNPGDAYDLDNVTTVTHTKTSISQHQLKEDYGAEIKAYAKAHGMMKPVEEMHRCWRVVYSDDVSFHLDTLPCIPEEMVIFEAIRSLGVRDEWALRAVAITDDRHPGYRQISSLWPSSNPRGFAKWFESRARLGVGNRLAQLVETRAYAKIDDVPPYEWKTPLQRSIQIMKRHRDVMFRDNLAVAPISMIITNLAAHAYQGELDVRTALTNIVERMPAFVRPTRPRIPNPTDPREDYADKWAANPELEDNFWAWHNQLSSDIRAVPAIHESDRLVKAIQRTFAIDLSERALIDEGLAKAAAMTITSAPTIQISSPPRPWRA
jgi:hypothetical protein